MIEIYTHFRILSNLRAILKNCVIFKPIYLILLYFFL